MIKFNNRSILLIILVIGFVLRFYRIAEIPFMHDEFSAIFRANFNSFSELIEKGIKIDGHPAGVQIFLFYLIKVFGINEWILKLPFLLMGVSSIYLVFIITKQWYNETVGLIISSYIASIQFTIMYSQIVRPYMSGLFFTLLMVYYWGKIIKEPQKDFTKNAIFYIISASVSTYIHHFSLLFVIIVGLSGLFLVEKKYINRYLISCILIAILYIPETYITIHQLSIGGVEGWLGKPESDFLINFIKYIFQFSTISLILILLIFFWSFYKNRTLKIKISKNHILFGSWFILPFLIGFIYSRYVNAVLQYSVLIFSFPYLFFIIFGHIMPQRVIVNLVLVLIIMVLNIYNLVFERQHYSLMYNSPYKELIIESQNAHKTYSDIISIIDSNEKISNYYINKLNLKKNFIDFQSFSNENEFRSFLKEQSKTHSWLSFGCLSSNNLINIPIIMEYYPRLVEQKNYFLASSYIFSKDIITRENNISLLNFETKNTNNWRSIDFNKYCASINSSGNYSYMIDSLTEWGPTFEKDLTDITNSKSSIIDISLKVKIPNKDSLDDLILVAILENKKILYWGGTPFSTLITFNDLDNWTSVYHSIRLSDVKLTKNRINFKTFIWNKAKKRFLIDDYKINVRDGNPFLYGLYEKI